MPDDATCVVFMNARACDRERVSNVLFWWAHLKTTRSNIEHMETMSLKTDNPDNSANPSERMSNPSDVVWVPLISSSSRHKLDLDLEKTRRISKPSDIFGVASRGDENGSCSGHTESSTSVCTESSFSSGLIVETPPPTKSLTIHELQSITSKLEQMDDLEEASEFFKLAMCLAFSKTTQITNECCQGGGRLYTTDTAARLELQGRMLRVTILTSVLRTTMAIKFDLANDFDRAIACCSGGRTVLDRDNITRYAQKANNGEVPLAGLVIVMLDLLRAAENSLKDRRQLLLKIASLRKRIEDVNIAAAELVSTKKQRTRTRPKLQEVPANFAQIVTDTSIQLLSALTLERKGRGAAVRYLQDALVIYKLACENIDPTTGREHSLLARLYRSSANDKAALFHFEIAAEMFNASTTSPRALGSILNDIAVLRMRRGEYGCAVQILRKSLWSYAQSPEDKTNTLTSLDSLQSWKNLGDCYSQEKEFGKAKAAFLQALNLQRNTRKMYDSIARLELGVVGMEKPQLNLITDDSIADTFLRLGNACAAAGSYQEALNVFTDALFEIRGYAEQLDCHDRATNASTTLIQVLFCAAEACTAVGQYAKAISFYENTMKLKGRFDSNESKAEEDLGLFCAMCCYGIGNVRIRMLDYTEAHKNYSDAILHSETKNGENSCDIADVIRSKLLETGDKMVAVAMVSTTDLTRLEERAALEQQRGEFDQAVTTLTAALMIRKSVLAHLKEAELDSVAEVRALVHLLRRFGCLFCQKGDTANAERAHRDANKLSHKFGVTTSSEFFLRTNVPTQHISLSCYLGEAYNDEGFAAAVES